MFAHVTPHAPIASHPTDDEAIKSLRSLRIKKTDFQLIKIIGRGGFGEVQLVSTTHHVPQCRVSRVAQVKHRQTSEVFALKSMSKCEMIKRSDTACFWEERNIMSHANSPWIVALHYSFQDEQFLYMIMDYMPGPPSMPWLHVHHTLDRRRHGHADGKLRHPGAVGQVLRRRAAAGH